MGTNGNTAPTGGIAHGRRARRGPVRGLRSLGLLAGIGAAVAAAPAIGGLVAARNGFDTYEGPPWGPPDWAPGLAWSILYPAMAVSAWLVARHGLDRPDVRRALAAFGVQLALNAAWVPLILGLRSPWLATVDIAALVLTIAITIRLFWPVSRPAASSLVPYLAWVAFATAITAWIALNE